MDSTKFLSTVLLVNTAHYLLCFTIECPKDKSVYPFIFWKSSSIMSSFYYIVVQRYVCIVHTYEYYSSSDQYITFWELKRILGFLIKSYCSAQEQKSRFAFHLCRKVIEHPVTLHKFYYNFMLEGYQEILVVFLDSSKMILQFLRPFQQGQNKLSKS